MSWYGPLARALNEAAEARTDFSAIERVWADPDWYERQRSAGQAEINALFVKHEAQQRAEQEQRWAAEEAARGEKEVRSC